MSYKIKYVKVMHNNWFNKSEFIAGDCTLFPISWFGNKLRRLYGPYKEWKYKKEVVSEIRNNSVFRPITRKLFLKNTKLTEYELVFIEEVLQPIIDKYYSRKNNCTWGGVRNRNNFIEDKDIEIMIMTIINNAKLR